MASVGIHTATWPPSSCPARRPHPGGTGRHLGQRRATATLLSDADRNDNTLICPSPTAAGSPPSRRSPSDRRFSCRFRYRPEPHRTAQNHTEWRRHGLLLTRDTRVATHSAGRDRHRRLGKGNGHGHGHGRAHRKGPRPSATPRSGQRPTDRDRRSTGVGPPP